MMAMIHGSRLSLVLALLEVAWFSPSDKKPEIDSFMELVRNLRNIVLNVAQPLPKLCLQHYLFDSIAHYCRSFFTALNMVGLYWVVHTMCSACALRVQF